jgi:hypothetical protein
VSRGLSTHYEVDQEGVVYRYLDPATAVAYHAGASANGLSIGIDLTHQGDDPWPAAQIEAAAELVQALCSRHGIPREAPPDRAPKGRAVEAPRPLAAYVAAGYGVVRHRDVYATLCPGELPFYRLAPIVQGRLLPPGDASPDEGVAGDTSDRVASAGAGGGGGGARALTVALAILRLARA